MCFASVCKEQSKTRNFVELQFTFFFQVQEELRTGNPAAHLNREHWDTWDPMLISEGLFAAANIFSNLKLVYIFSVNPYLGPLQVSLSRMVMDILKFMTLFILVLFAFSCGKNLSKHLIIVPVRFSKARKNFVVKIPPFLLFD